MQIGSTRNFVKASPLAIVASIKNVGPIEAGVILGFHQDLLIVDGRKLSLVCETTRELGKCLFNLYRIGKVPLGTLRRFRLLYVRVNFWKIKKMIEN